MAANPWRIGSNTGKRGETRGEGEENGREGDVDEPLIQKTREISKKQTENNEKGREREGGGLWLGCSDEVWRARRPPGGNSIHVLFMKLNTEELNREEVATAHKIGM